MDWLTEHPWNFSWIGAVVFVFLLERFIVAQVGRIVDAIRRVDAKLYDLVQGQDRQYNEWTNDIFSIRDGVATSRNIEEQMGRLDTQLDKVLGALEDAKGFIKLNLPEMEATVRRATHLLEEVAVDVRSMEVNGRPGEQTGLP